MSLDHRCPLCDIGSSPYLSRNDGRRMATQSVPLERGELSLRGRLQALRDCLQWVYEDYDNVDSLFRDCHLMLRSLQVGEKTLWGARRLAGFIDTLSVEDLITLQLAVREEVENFPPSPRKAKPFILLESFGRILVQS